MLLVNLYACIWITVDLIGRHDSCFKRSYSVVIKILHGYQPIRFENQKELLYKSIDHTNSIYHPALDQHYDCIIL